MTFTTNKYKNLDLDKNYHVIALKAIIDEPTYSTILELFINTLSEIRDSSVDELEACLTKCQGDICDHVLTLMVSAYRCARF
jgi:hypothetical protein